MSGAVANQLQTNQHRNLAHYSDVACSVAEAINIWLPLWRERHSDGQRSVLDELRTAAAPHRHHAGRLTDCQPLEQRSMQVIGAGGHEARVMGLRPVQHESAAVDRTQAPAGLDDQ
jgi:hypothetical protein